MIWGLLGFSWPTVAVADPITDKIEKERKTLDQLKYVLVGEGKDTGIPYTARNDGSARR
jgi:hypothetical protein